MNNKVWEKYFLLFAIICYFSTPIWWSYSLIYNCYSKHWRFTKINQIYLNHNINMLVILKCVVLSFTGINFTFLINWSGKFTYLSSRWCTTHVVHIRMVNKDKLLLYLANSNWFRNILICRLEIQQHHKLIKLY